MDEEYEEYPEEQIYFSGCTCEHPKEAHGWGHSFSGKSSKSPPISL